MAPLNSPARRVAGLACLHASSLRTSERLFRGEAKVSSSARAADERGRRVICKTSRSSEEQLATNA
eukprot:4362973-Pleurochrysis_carterae.AAC.1